MEQELIERRRVDPAVEEMPSPEVLAVLELCGDARESDRGARAEGERRDSVSERRHGDRRARAPVHDERRSVANARVAVANLLAVCLIPTLLVVGRRLRSA